jgi:hypothetical protein
MGRPASGPSFAPRERRASMARAALSASSGRKVTIALTFGFRRSICAM